MSLLHKTAAPMSFTFVRTRHRGGRSIIGGPIFRQLLAQEKKRSERSGNSFVLVVLPVAERLHCQGEAFAVFERRIFSQIRDTDLVGWYDENEWTLGILFTEIGEASETNERSASAVLDRVKEIISPHTLQERQGKIRCTVFERGRRHYDGSLEPHLLTGD